MSNPAVNPYNATLSMDTQNTEYSYTFPLNVKRIFYKLRDQGNDLRVSWTSGVVANSNGPYMTLWAGATNTIDQIDSGAQITLYFATGVDNQVLELEIWT